MVPELRWLLFLGALLTLLFFLSKIRKNRLQIGHAISWSVFSGMVLLVSIFPGIIVWTSGIFGFESPSNFVYLVIIFILVVKLFTTSIKISHMDHQITELIQHIAIREKEDDDTFEQINKKETIK